MSRRKMPPKADGEYLCSGIEWGEGTCHDVPWSCVDITPDTTRHERREPCLGRESRTMLRDGLANPFGATALWPPLDDDGVPRPLLVAVLVVVATVVARLFYFGTHRDPGSEIRAKKNSTLAAQMTVVLADQQSRFTLEKVQVEQLLEMDPDNPRNFEAKDDLTVKLDLRLVADIGTSHKFTREAGLQKVETQVKGRTLTTVISSDGSMTAVNTTEELERCIAQQKDSNYPLTFVLRSTPPEAQRLYDLLVDDIYDVVVTQHGVLETDPFFAAMRGPLQRSRQY